MAEDRRRSRRGRRGRGRPSDRSPEERPEESQPEVAEESEAPGVLPSRPRFRFGRRRDREEEGTEERHREERQAAGAPADVSPLSFWRRGRSRTYREQPIPKQTLGRTWRRIRGMYVPPWVPVLVIILVVFGILGALFFARGATGKPRINDHWHATYEVLICGERQPNFPEWDAAEGVHTHADGIIHIHPFIPAGEGAGSRLVKWFEYGGGKLTQTEMQMPGTPKDEVYKNGDTCDDGSEAVLQVFVNGAKMDDWSRFISKDGDRVRIEFGPQRSTPVKLDDRTLIAEGDATRTVELEVSGGEGDAAFAPASIDLKTGETVKLVVKNTGAISHTVRVAGPDGEYGTSDDFVATTADESDIIKSGEEGVMVVRFDEAGEFAFQDPSAPVASGTLVVAGAPEEETAEAEPDASQPVDVTLTVAMGDNSFEPIELEVGAGLTFRIELINEGEFVHNIRIAGPDDTYKTEDDLVSTPSPLGSGESGQLVGKFDEPGVYRFRSDFPPSGEMVGTITVK